MDTTHCNDMAVVAAPRYVCADSFELLATGKKEFEGGLWIPYTVTVMIVVVVTVAD